MTPADQKQAGHKPTACRNPFVGTLLILWHDILGRLLIPMGDNLLSFLT